MTKRRERHCTGNRNRRSIGCHQLLLRRPRAGIRGNVGEGAEALCDAPLGALFLAEGGHFRAVAMRGGTEAWHDRMTRLGFPGTETPASAPLVAGERFVHIVDVAKIDHPMARAAVQAVGVRTLLSVPLRKDDGLCGIIIASRGEVRPFTDKQIALLQNFAAQAVIAMENARLLFHPAARAKSWSSRPQPPRYCRSSTPRPATSHPVFDAMLERAHPALRGRLTVTCLPMTGDYFFSTPSCD